MVVDWPPRPFVSPEWLATALKEPAEAIEAGKTLVVVDCRYSFDPATTGSGYDMYRAGHIPSAVYLDWTVDISAPVAETGVPWMIAGPSQFSQAMQRLGIGDNTVVVGYDHEGGHYASRLWWALRYYGHDSCYVLHGGIQAWQAAGYTLEAGDAPPAQSAVTSPFTIGHIRTELRYTADEVQALPSQHPEALLLDVRRRSEYDGTERRAARAGRIPGSTHLFWREALNWAADAGGPASGTGDGSRTLRPADELRGHFEQAGVVPDRPIVTYCQGGVRAAHTALVLSALGYPNVAVYDGSWEEWGNDPSRPILASDG